MKVGDKVHVRGTVLEIQTDRVFVVFEFPFGQYVKHEDIVRVESPTLKVGCYGSLFGYCLVS